MAVQDGDELLWGLLGLPLHRRYRPLGKIDRQIAEDGTELRSYTTGTGASFEAALDALDYTTRISGAGLKLKEQLDIDGRGYTGEAVGKVPGAGMHSAHLIADAFTGSGYKEAGNLIATSASYNWLEMAAAEDSIREAIERYGAESFDMDVAVEWGDLDDATVLASRVDEAVMAALAADPDMTKREIAALRKEESKRLRESLATFQERYGEDVRRCMGVKYNVRLQLPDGSEVTLDEIALGADRYLGFEEEPQTAGAEV